MGILRKRAARRLGFESLEGRNLMAGLVGYAITNGNLVVQGDSSANAIEIVGTGTAGEVVLRGLVDQATGQATQISGATGDSVTLTGVTGNVKVELFSGHDEFYINNISVSGSLDVFPHDGNDIIRIGTYVPVNSVPNPDPGIVAAHMGIKVNSIGYTGNKNVFIGRAYAFLDLEVKTGSGADYIQFYNIATEQCRITVDMGAGDDVANVAYLSQPDDGSQFTIQQLWITGREGNDLISVITTGSYSLKALFHGDSGSDYIAMNSNHFYRRAQISGGGGNDTVFFTNSICVGLFEVFGEDGIDDIRLENNTMGSVSLYGNAGNDVINLKTCVIADLAIDGMMGSDTVYLYNNVLNGAATIKGGAAEFDVGVYSANYAPNLIWENFEYFIT